MKYRNNKERFITKLDTVIESLEEQYLHTMFKEKKVYGVINEIQDFINEIKLKNYDYHDVFNNQLAFKTDIYGISFIINEMANKLVYTHDNQKIAMYNIYKMCEEINPYKRANIDQIISYIDEIHDITVKYGGNNKRQKNLKRLVIPKIHHKDVNKEMKIYKKKMPYIIKLSLKLKIKLVIYC